jgi:hypothetical protein
MSLMRRRTFYALLSSVGVVLTIVLAAAGGLLLWAYSYTNSQVTSQLSEQKIVFPATDTARFKSLPPADRAALAPYAGQMMTTGAQARAWADHLIARDLKRIGGGKTFSELSKQLLASPGNPALAKKVQTVFQGTTLRGLLLNAYAFWQLGQIALISGIAALCAAFVLLVLSLLGFWHMRRISPDAELLLGSGHR